MKSLVLFLFFSVSMQLLVSCNKDETPVSQEMMEQEEPPIEAPSSFILTIESSFYNGGGFLDQ